ncbi:MAG: GTP-binding protein [Deltaproteobacteria bacterium]|nr:MAG: GTP-binding protein [Deltaproteobacteria bacterium]
MTQPTPIPALIVSGFLGAGKTTLVQHLLEQAQAEGVRLAIVSNEFGDTGIDRALMDAGEEGFVELDGGCVCCRLSDALSETLEALLTQVKPDRLVLETSGVALPGEIVIQFWRPPLSELISDEVVAVVVDAERLAETEELDETSLTQLEAADLVVLNKRDLVDESTASDCAARLDELTAGQPVLEATYGRLEASALFPPDPEELRKRRRDASATIGAHSHEHFNTEELSFPGVVDPDAVLAKVAEQQAVRAKGFVRTAAGVQVVQGVGRRIEITTPKTPIPEDLVGRVVIIRRE